MVPTPVRRIVGRDSSKDDDSSSSLVRILMVASTGACLAGLGYYYSSCRKSDRKGHGSAGEKNNDKNDSHTQDVGDWGKPKKAKRTGKGTDGDEDSSCSSSSFQLPQHLQRELYKDERRKASVRFLAMKKPLYENIEMYAPDGTTMLCTIGRKKANWYVRKQLAVWKVPPDIDTSSTPEHHPSIRLLFEPKNHQKKKSTSNGDHDANNGGIDHEDEEQMRKYNCTHKLNICVSCGAQDTLVSSSSSENNTENDRDGIGGEDNTDNNNNNNTGLMRHYVVPYAYRRLLPKKFKTHLPHDVVLLCLDCHVDAEQAAKTLKSDVYEKLYRTDPRSKPAMVTDHTIKTIQSKARALWKHKHKLPLNRIEEYESEILVYLSKTTDTNNSSQEEKQQQENGTEAATTNNGLSEAVLRDLALNLEPEQRNPHYIPLANLVVENLCRTDTEIQDFVVGWRQFFVDTLQPRHMPAGWSVDSPVRVDVEREDDDRLDETEAL